MAEAEDAGAIYAQLRLELTQMEKDGLDADKAMNRLAGKFKKQGQTAGKGFAGGMKQGFDNVDSAAAKLGRSIATKLSPAILAIGAGIKIFQGIGRAIGDAFNSNEKFTKSMDDFKTAMGQNFANAMRPVSDFFANIIEKAARSVRQAQALREALDHIRNENFADSTTNLNTALTQKREAYTALLTEIANLQSRIDNMNPHSGSPAARARRRREFEELKAEYQRQADELLPELMELQLQAGYASEAGLAGLEEIEEELKRAYKEVDVLIGAQAINQQQADEMRLSALNNYINKVAELSAKEGGQHEVYKRRLRDQVDARDELIARLNTEADTQEKIDKAREAAMEKYNHAFRRAQDALDANLINEEEHERQLHSAMATKYSDLEAIAIQYNLTTGEIVRLRDATAELVRQDQELVKSRENQKGIDSLILGINEELMQTRIEAFKAEAASAKTEADRNAALEDALYLELQLFDIQRKRARDTIEQSEEFIAATDAERAAILLNFDLITEARRKAIQNADNDDSFLEKIFGSEKFGLTMQVGQAALDSYNTIADAALEITRQHAEEQIAIIENALKTTLKSIEDARKADLVASGFAVQNCEESLEAQLEAAKRTGDEVLIYLAQRRLEEQRINDKFDEEARLAEEEAAKEKAEIEYGVAMQEYQNKMISAINSGIMAVLNALATPGVPWPVALAFGGAAGIATGAQIALLAKNPPKRQVPGFANSGIVPGNKYAGDQINARLDSGELILNRAHQDNIADQLTTNSVVRATIVVAMDSREMAKSTIDLVNDGFYTIKARAIR